ncbi:MAG: hypothetical protein ABIJ92_00995 [Candidatus Aenigmatarchaeota archaeon]
MRLSLLILIVSLLILPSVNAHIEQLSSTIEGDCREYNVTVVPHGFTENCYDVKIDVTSTRGRVGEIFDSREGWKSSFFYVSNDLCISDSEVFEKTYQVRADDSEILNFKTTIRFGEKLWSTEYYEITQGCPELVEGDDKEFWISTGIVLIVLLASIVYYVKLSE